MVGGDEGGGGKMYCSIQNCFLRDSTLPGQGQSSYIVGPSGDLRLLDHQLRLEVFLEGHVSSTVVDFLPLEDPDFLCYLVTESDIMAGQHHTTFKLIDSICRMSMVSISR